MGSIYARKRNGITYYVYQEALRVKVDPLRSGKTKAISPVAFSSLKLTTACLMTARTANRVMGEHKITPLSYYVWVNNAIVSGPARRVGQGWRATRAPWRGPVDGQGSMSCLSPNLSSIGLNAINSRGSGGQVPQVDVWIELSGDEVHNSDQVPG